MKRYIVVCGIVKKGEEFLLGKKRADMPPYPNEWHTLGGYVEDTKKGYALYQNNDWDNTYFHEELKREMKSQANIEIDNITNICPKYREKPRTTITQDEKGEDAEYIFLEYISDYAGGEIIPDAYFEEWRWHNKKDLKNLKLTPPSREMYVELGWDWLW